MGGSINIGGPYEPPAMQPMGGGGSSVSEALRKLRGLSLPARPVSLPPNTFSHAKVRPDSVLGRVLSIFHKKEPIAPLANPQRPKSMQAMEAVMGDEPVKVILQAKGAPPLPPTKPHEAIRQAGLEQLAKTLKEVFVRDAASRGDIDELQELLQDPTLSEGVKKLAYKEAKSANHLDAANCIVDSMKPPTKPLPTRSLQEGPPPIPDRSKRMGPFEKSIVNILTNLNTKGNLSSDELLLGYKRSMSTLELFSACRSVAQNGTDKEKKAVADFALSWLQSGYFTDEVQEMKGILAEIGAYAHNEALQNIGTTAPKEQKATLQSNASTTDSAMMERVHKGKYTQSDSKNYAASLTNAFSALLKHASMSEMFVDNTKQGFAEKAPHLKAALDFQMKVTQKVQVELIGAKEGKVRERLYQFYANVAVAAWKQGDITTAQSIAAALESPAASRTLKQDYGVKLPDIKEYTNILEIIKSPSKYSAALADMRKKGPVLPGLTNFYKEYAGADVQNPGKAESGEVNSSSIEIYAKLTQALAEFKQMPTILSTKAVSDLEEQIKETALLPSETIYQRSLTNFPRK